MEDGLNYLDEKERQNTIDEVVSQVGLSHLITFDGYVVCEQVRLSPLSKFHVTLLNPLTPGKLRKNGTFKQQIAFLALFDPISSQSS